MTFMRVVVVGDNGRKHLDILRILATAPQALISVNHAVPMIREVQLGHIYIWCLSPCELYSGRFVG